MRRRSWPPVRTVKSTCRPPTRAPRRARSSASGGSSSRDACDRMACPTSPTRRWSAVPAAANGFTYPGSTRSRRRFGHPLRHAVEGLRGLERENHAVKGTIDTPMAGPASVATRPSRRRRGWSRIAWKNAHLADHRFDLRSVWEPASASLTFALRHGFRMIGVLVTPPGGSQQAARPACRTSWPPAGTRVSSG